MSIAGQNVFVSENGCWHRFAICIIYLRYARWYIAYELRIMELVASKLLSVKRKLAIA